MCTNTRTINLENSPLSEESKYALVVNPDGSTKSVLKSTIVWLLTESKGTLSSDRLKRVRSYAGTSNENQQKRRNRNVNQLSFNLLIKSDEISVGEWCIFQLLQDKNLNFDELSEQYVVQNCVIGAIAGFKFEEGKSETEKEFKFDTASLSCETFDKKRKLMVLSTWYKWDAQGVLHPHGHINHFFVCMDNYIATSVKPLVQKNHLNQKIITIQNVSDVNQQLHKFFLS